MQVDLMVGLEAGKKLGMKILKNGSTWDALDLPDKQCKV